MPVLDSIEGVSVTDLLERFGSPLFVLSEPELVRRHQELMTAFRVVDPRVVLAWSMKTNPLEAVSRILQRGGAGVEVAGDQEYRKARRLGFGGNEILVNGPVKPPALIERAIADGAALHVDSLSELAQIERIAARLGVCARTALRIAPQIPQLAGWSRFGLDQASGAASVAAHQLLNSSHLAWCGLACHLGTQLMDPMIFRDAAAALAAFDQAFRDKRGTPLEYVDLGGGFASRTVSLRSLASGGEPPPPPSFDAYASAIQEGLGAFGAHPPRLVLETGRALVDSCGTFLATVRVRKRLPDGRSNLVLDGGVNLLHSAFGFRHTVRPTVKRNGPTGPTLITGPVPMAEDVLADQVAFPPMEEGDALAFLDAGAYNLALWWQFITYRPAVVLVGPDGEVDVVREAETFESVTERERLPERLDR